MKTLRLRVPDSLHHELKQRAQQEGVSLNQLLVVAASKPQVNTMLPTSQRLWLQSPMCLLLRATKSFCPKRYDAIAAVTNLVALCLRYRHLEFWLEEFKKIGESWQRPRS